MSCSRYTFPPSVNHTIASALDASLNIAFNLHMPLNGQVPSEAFLAQIYCANDAQNCYGICSNADLAGIGVRIAFWLSSTLQALLVSISPEDSTQGAWTAAVLTASIIIPAIKQKKQQSLTLYHATLVLNFATFSSVVSLAVAPMCTVWRESASDGDMNLEQEVVVFGEEGRQPILENSEPLTNIPRHTVHRQRLVLSLALLAQVSLQWTWAVMLFTNPEYAQRACSPDTTVYMFGHGFTARQINQDSFAVWPIWLLFNVGVTLFWGILLVYSSSSSVHPVLSRRASDLSTVQPTWRGRFSLDKGRMLVLSGNCMAFFVALLFLVTSEVQAQRNCIRGGENSDWSFGQVAAMLLALAPAWAIAMAIAKRSRRAVQILADEICSSAPEVSVIAPSTADLTSESMAPDRSKCTLLETQSASSLNIPRTPRRRATLDVRTLNALTMV